MTTHEQYGRGDEGTVHEAVGAYVLGILDESDAIAFEAHLAGCRVCAVHMEEFAGMEPMLALLADNPDPFASLAPPGPPGRMSPPGQMSPPVTPLSQLPTPSVSVQPTPSLLDSLVDEVAVKRAQRKRRGMYLIAAAAALIIGGPLGVATLSGGDKATGVEARPTTLGEDFKLMTDKVSGTDATTKVSATVAMEAKAWGTETALELKNVKGPLKCSLIAVSKNGDEEVITSWSVPEWGYGLPDSPNPAGKSPLYIQGGTAMDQVDIDHFVVRTFDGKQLVEIDA